jgi:hypothetical protein
MLRLFKDRNNVIDMGVEIDSRGEPRSVTAEPRERGCNNGVPVSLQLRNRQSQVEAPCQAPCTRMNVDTASLPPTAPDSAVGQ